MTTQFVPEVVSPWTKGLEVKYQSLVEAEELQPSFNSVLSLPVILSDVHATGISVYDECPRKFMWQYRYGLRRRGQEKTALAFGTIMHLLLADLYSGKSWGEAVEKVDNETKIKMRELEEKDPILGMATSSEYCEMVETVKAMVKIFWDMYPLDTDRFRVIAVEQPIRLLPESLNSPFAALNSTIDTLLLDTKKDEAWVVDHKSTSVDTKVRAAYTSWDYQTQIYPSVVKAAYPGIRLAGVIFNILRKPSIRYSPFGKDRLLQSPDYSEAIVNKIKQGKQLTEIQAEAKAKADREYQEDRKFNSSFEKFLHRLKISYQNLESEGGTPPFIQSWNRFSSVVMSDEMKTKWLLVSDACRIKDLLPERFYRNPRSCSSAYGVCEYLPLCSEPVLHLPEVIKNMYRQEMP